MKALVLDRANTFRYEERPIPQCLPGQLLVRMEAVCICGSDLHAIRGDQPLFSFPRVIGHEAAGRVAEVGEGVRGFSVGDQVCLMPCIPCGTCRACQRGRTNACARLNLYGVHQDGGLQEYLAAPAQNWLKTDRPAPAQEIAMLEPLTIGAHAAAKLELAPGDRVLVTGAGPIGISCALNAQTYGARVLLSDTNPGRRAFAAERFRLLALDPLDEHFTEQTAQFTENSLFDAVIDTTAAKASMEQTWRWIGQGGKIVFVGICGGTLELDGLRFHLKEPSLFVTRNSTRPDYERVMNFWRLGAFIPWQFITHQAAFDDAGQTLAAWTRPEAGVFKGVVLF